MSFTLEEGQRRFTEIHVLDEPGADGAYHEYRVNPVDIVEGVPMPFATLPAPPLSKSHTGAAVKCVKR